MTALLGRLGPNGAPYVFTDRHGGTSKTPFASLNLSLTLGDDAHHVRQNRARAAAFVERPAHSVVSVTQVHRNEAVQVTAQASPHIEADALITQDVRATLTILVADCVPIVMASSRGDAVAAVHAGWRGTAGRIAQEAALRLAAVADCATDSLWAQLGPAIGPCCFVVDEPVALTLQSAYPTVKDAFRPSFKGRIAIDLWALNRRALLDAGLPEAAVQGDEICTCCSSDYFSYRREGAPCGRQGALIALPHRA